MTTITCRAQDKLACRIHGKDLLTDQLFAQNQRILGWSRDTFPDGAEATLHGIMTLVGEAKPDRTNLAPLIQRVKREDLSTLNPYFNIEVAVAEIAYRYAGNTGERPLTRNHLANPTVQGGPEDRYKHALAAYLVANGDIPDTTGARWASTDRYLNGHGQHGTCEIDFVSEVEEAAWAGPADPSYDYDNTEHGVSGKVYCRCGRLHGHTMRARGSAGDMLRFVTAQML